MRVVSIVGARPQFVKLAPVSRSMADAAATSGLKFDDVIVHTGQHYDRNMSDVFFDELRIPRPDVQLEVGSGLHGAQTAKMLEGIESVLVEKRPDIVVIYGDTNSTVAGALAAAKLHIPIAHIEAGLRSFNKAMPEEINRIVADHVSDLLLAPTKTAMRNLASENLQGISVFTGDVMLDAVRFNAGLARKQSTIIESLGIERNSYAVVTIHRASNTNPEKLLPILDALNEIATRHLPIVFPAHPRTITTLQSSEAGWQPVPEMRVIDPVGYLDMLSLLDNAKLVLTDSGGLQKEAFFLRVPCVTLREETEWPETVNAGGNVLAGAEPARILSAVEEWSERMAGPWDDGVMSDGSPFGDGNAAGAIVREIARFS